jgi:hypothetical protein
MVPFHFAILRYVPNLVAGEFVNVGIVMFVPGISNSVKYKISSDYKRIIGLWPGFDIVEYEGLFSALLDRCYRVAGFGAAQGIYKTPGRALRSILPRGSSCWQLSPIMSGLCDEPSKRIEELFCDLVLRHTGNGYDKGRTYARFCNAD